jgi:hypothetical protein
MGQAHFDSLVKVIKREAVREMPQITKPTNTLCKHCQQGKKTKTRFKSKEYSTIRPLEIVHTNLVGPTKTKVLKGEKYFMLLVDDYTRMTIVFFLKNKSKYFENFNIYKEMVENEMDSKINCSRYNNVGEFTSKEFMDYCNNHGIKKKFSIAMTPQQNGVQKNHPSDQIIRNKDAGVEIRRKIHSPEQSQLALLSTIEPNFFEEARKDGFWKKAMDEELDQIEKNETGELVPRPKNKNVISTKWVFRNKLNEYGQITRNKVRLVCK